MATLAITAPMPCVDFSAQLAPGYLGYRVVAHNRILMLEFRHERTDMMDRVYYYDTSFGYVPVVFENIPKKEMSKFCKHVDKSVIDVMEDEIHFSKSKQLAGKPGNTIVIPFVGYVQCSYNAVNNCLYVITDTRVFMYKLS